jgi:hypothetical protein
MRKWHISSSPIFDELENVHPVEKLRTVVYDLAECGREVTELRAEVNFLRSIIETMKEKGTK